VVDKKLSLAIVSTIIIISSILGVFLLDTSVEEAGTFEELTQEEGRLVSDSDILPGEIRDSSQTTDKTLVETTDDSSSFGGGSTPVTIEGPFIAGSGGSGKQSIGFIGTLDAPTHDAPHLGAHDALTLSLWTNTVGYWEFEGNALDETTNDNDGTVSGATLTEEGYVGSAYEFDGVDNYINMGDPASLDISGTFTISAWVKLGDVGNGAIVQKGGYIAADGTLLYYDSATGRLTFKGNGVGGSDFSIKSNSAFTIYQWYHVVAVYNGSNETLYVDNVLQSETGGQTDNYLDLNDNVEIGGYSDQDFDFNGTIDEVHIWSRALSVTEIESLYNTSTGIYAYANQDLGAGTNNTADNEGDDIKNIFNWYVDGTSLTALNMPFENNTADTSATTKDYTNYENNGTVTNAIWNPTEGFDGKGAYEFDGDGDFINASDDSSLVLNATQGLSIELWLKLNPTGSTVNALEKRASASNYYKVVANGTGGLSCLFGNTASILYLSDVDVSDSQWHHVVCTVGVDEGPFKTAIYLDGQFVNTGQSDYEGLVGSSGDLLIGTGSDGDWNGSLDEVRIWQKALSEQQVLELFNNNSNNFVNQETKAGEVWNVTITPNDGTEDGTTKWSNPVPIIGSLSPPTYDDPILNATTIYNQTSDNLTIWIQNAFDTDGDDIKFIYNWYMNNSPLMVLNMPFEDDSDQYSTKDYSPYSNNGTVVGGGSNPYKPTGGYDGFGAYEFDGVDSHMNISHDEVYNFNISDDFAITVWLKIPSIQEDLDYTHNVIIEKWDNNTAQNRYPFSIMYFNKNQSTDPCKINFHRWAGLAGGASYVRTSGQVNDSQWHHYAFVKNGTQLYIYIDGVFDNNGTDGLTADPTNDQKIHIAKRSWTAGGISDYTFKGSIDDLAIWNRTLSPEQVNALANSRWDLMIDPETEVSDFWNATVTPYDGDNDGETKWTNTVEILGCIDADCDGAYMDLPGCCTPNVDCDCNDADANILPPVKSMFIDRSLTFCSGTYNLFNANNTVNIFEVNTSNVTVTCDSTVFVGNTSGSGLVTNGNNNITVQGCTFNNYNISLYLRNGNSFNIKNNILESSERTILMDNVVSSVFNNNTFINLSTGITGSAQNSNFTENLFVDPNLEESWTWGIQIWNAVFNNNLIMNNQFVNLSNGTGIRLYHAQGSNTIYNNTFDNLDDNGIRLEGTNTTNITGNTFTNIDKRGIWIYDESFETYVSDNEFYDISLQAIVVADSNFTNIINNDIINVNQEGIDI